MEISTFAELINRKIVFPDTKSGFMYVESHFLVDCMTPILEKIRVDETWYLRAYPDVQEAIQRGAVKDAQSHYCRFGFFEHRMPYYILVDEAWYLKQYPDVRAALADLRFASGQAHFDVEGFREGRFPYANFRLDLTGGFKLNGKTPHTTPARLPAKSRDSAIHVDSTPY